MTVVHVSGFNQTIVGLKLEWFLETSEKVLGFNQTIVGLKFFRAYPYPVYRT